MEPTIYDQYMLELINRARLDPDAEADRYSIDLNEGLLNGTISNAPKQPLAFNFDLFEAAVGHTQWMLNNDVFSHAGADNSSSFNRMTDAGYSWLAAAENLAYQVTSGTPNVTSMVAQNHEALFVDENVSGRGHRKNLMNGNYREIGISSLTGEFEGWNAVMVTQDFGKSNTGPFLTGVAYDDIDGDSFYDPGEGLDNITVDITGDNGTFSTNTMTAGGYQIALPAGDYTVTFSGNGLDSSVSKNFSIASDNIKVDVLSEEAVNTGQQIDGTTGNDTLQGEATNDIINGGDGNDLIRGGAGTDTMTGGTGNDIYGVDETGDLINENPSEGTDIVQSTVSYTLPANVEVLNLRGSNDPIDGTGNDRDNSIVGNNADNVLSGGLGEDLVIGHGGNDSLNGGDGNDRLYGNAGNDIINGGDGADTMRGGTEDDIYFVENSGDRIAENAGEGTDTVSSSITYTLIKHLENLELTGSSSIKGIGNNENNSITGNDGNNVLRGMAGDDTLTGGAGEDILYGDAGDDSLIGGGARDRFVYRTGSSFTSADVGEDVIVDFSSSDTDKIILSKTTFDSLNSTTGLGFSVVAEFEAVASDAAAATSDASIVYNSNNGKLFYNPDGSAAGFGSGGLFATLNNNAQLAANDFVLQS